VARIDLFAEIRPGESAGGASLATDITELLAIERPKWIRKFGEHTLYSFGAVRVSTVLGRVSQIGVYEGYFGKVAGVIGIGSSLRDVEAWSGCEISEDDEDNLVVRNVGGLVFETERWVNGPETRENLDARIDMIFVYAPTL